MIVECTCILLHACSHVRKMKSGLNRNGRVVECATLWHHRPWVRVPDQAIGSSLNSDLGATYACGYIWQLQVHGSKWLGCHAIYTLIQCTLLLVEKAGVPPDMTLGITVCEWERVQARDPLWIWNPWGRTHKVQNRSNQWFHKMGLGPTKLKKKKKEDEIEKKLNSPDGYQMSLSVLDKFERFPWEVPMSQFRTRVNLNNHIFLWESPRPIEHFCFKSGSLINFWEEVEVKWTRFVFSDPIYPLPPQNLPGRILFRKTGVDDILILTPCRRFTKSWRVWRATEFCSPL